MGSETPVDPRDELPTPRVLRRRWLPSLIWLVPAAAAVIGASLVVNAWRTAGPRIEISFQTAQGLEVGKTLVKYRNVTIGHVTAISLSSDHNQVRVTADLLRTAKDLLTADARFWVVRPRIGIGWASGLDTLLSGSYIAVEAGEAKTTQTEFVGVENPPPLNHGLLGKSVVLHAKDVGSLALDAPVYFRHFEVGHVIDRELEADGRGARVVVFVDAPYDRLVTRATRFWNASGIDLSLGADGLKVRTQSIASVLAGGVAFESVPTATDVGPVASGAEFTLFVDETTAMAPPDGEPRYVRMRFTQSLRGLSVGAPVEFVGVNIGQVFSIDLDYDAKHKKFPVVVTALIYPQRMGKAYEVLEQNGTATSEEKMAKLVGELVERGLRAQPRTGNLLTGQLYIALDFIPGAAPASFAVDAQPLEIPTTPGSIQELQQKLVSVIDKIDRLPIADIGRHLDADIVGLNGVLGDLRTDVLPAGTAAFQSLNKTLGSVDHALADDAPWRDNINQTLIEAQSTLRSVRSLADYLDRHPEALIRGRHDSKSPASEKARSAVQGPSAAQAPSVARAPSAAPGTE
jgi:paraquat-inducible protein B